LQRESLLSHILHIETLLAVPLLSGLLSGSLQLEPELDIKNCWNRISGASLELTQLELKNTVLQCVPW